MSYISGFVYIFGGIANNKFTNTIYVFDPKSNEFSLIEDPTGDIPEPRAFHNSSVIGTRLVIYGGFN